MRIELEDLIEALNKYTRSPSFGISTLHASEIRRQLLRLQELDRQMKEGTLAKSPWKAK